MSCLKYASLFRGSFPHAAQIEYRYDRVRDLRRLGATHRPGSTGCIEKECIQAGSEKELTHKGRLEKAVDELSETSQFVSGEPSRRHIVYATGGTGSRIPPRSTNFSPARRGDSKKNTRQGTGALEVTQIGEQRASG